MRPVIAVLLSFAVVATAIGCSRTRYRQAADRDSYQIVQEKSACLAEHVPPNFSIQPDARSRFYDPTNPDCPQLPVPRPVLYGYSIPPLASDRRQAPQFITNTSLENEIESEPQNDSSSSKVIPASHQQPSLVKLAEPPLKESPESADSGQKATAKISDSQDNTTNRSAASPISKISIPPSAWEVLPQICINRMFEFESLRQEFQQSYPESKRKLEDQQIRRLTLANMMELATINSREFQTRKEQLFRAALVLTRQRYRYELNPTPFGVRLPFGNGTAADYRHLRSGGVTENRLSIPSTVGVQKSLATGGEFLARFANSVVLTFNGPSGFATDIGSEMVLDFQQTLLQRDVRFELLTQAERDVVYEAREYIRFRKLLFRDIASLYYNLLLNYRTIAINAQDYFTNLRGFIQSQSEYRTAEKIPRIQVDQFEQNVLRARGNLVNNCFALETAIDQLKLRLGMPIESPFNIDLIELESISLKDELSVARQMIQRARKELLNARNASGMDATTLANVAEVLADRIWSILQIQHRIESMAVQDESLKKTVDTNREAFERTERELSTLRQLLQILGLRMQVDLLRTELYSQLSAETPAPPMRVIIRALEFCSAELQVVDTVLESDQGKSLIKDRDSIIRRRDKALQEIESLRAFLDKISSSVKSATTLGALDDFQAIPEKMKMSIRLVELLDQLGTEVTASFIPATDMSLESKVVETVDKTIRLSDQLLEKGPDGWEEIVVEHDEAILTGLVQRLDLMNQRGDLADAWRQIKLAGDDLRSIVDLQATHVLRTNSANNKPFDFTFDDSETRLSVALDTPLNRRLQRNNFRVALINYNVGLRNLMAAEDAIKLDIREDLRQLALDRSQYAISVASAALAYERVISTKMRLQLGVQNVAARDFLEAQQAYTLALSSIARQHINYITDRTELFFDLEAFDVDSCGYWSGVREDYGPGINVDFPATNPRPYDWLPPRVWYSPTIRQMEQIPPGQSMVFPKE